MKPYQGVRVYAVMFRHPEPTRPGRRMRFSKRWYLRARAIGIDYVRAEYSQEGDVHNVHVKIVRKDGRVHHAHYRYDDVPYSNILMRLCSTEIKEQWDSHCILHGTPLQRRLHLA